MNGMYSSHSFVSLLHRRGVPNLSLQQYSQEELREMSFVELASLVLYEKKEALSFQQLVNEVAALIGLSEQEVTEACRYIKAHGALSLSAIGTSQEGADEETIREIALLNKRCGIDIQHIGDAGFCGIALPENIMALSIAIRGKRHTYHKIASSINR